MHHNLPMTMLVNYVVIGALIATVRGVVMLEDSTPAVLRTFLFWPIYLVYWSVLCVYGFLRVVFKP